MIILWLSAVCDGPFNGHSTVWVWFVMVHSLVILLSGCGLWWSIHWSFYCLGVVCDGPFNGHSTA